MRVDVRVDGVAEGMDVVSRELEAQGYDGVWVAEAGNDPFLPLGMVAEHTTDIQLGTAIAVAFGRSPLTAAQIGWDLNRFSQGRFVLGIGSQVRSHIERRYSMPWSSPARRMREFIGAMRAIWATWQEQTPLDFRGEFYTHTLMSPVFAPQPNQWGGPPVHLAAVGPLMTRTAAEVADGLRTHSFTTEQYLRQRTLPLVMEGLERAGRARESFEISYPVMVVAGRDEGELAAGLDNARRRLSFYGSTPSYRDVLDLHGWGDLQTELHALSREGRWDEMPDLVPDEVVQAFAVVGAVDDIAGEIERRYDGVVDRVSLYLGGDDIDGIVGRALIDHFGSRRPGVQS